MSQHRATIRWSRNGATFTDNNYSRGHSWSFDGGAVVAASASPDVVPLPHSVAENVDPEEAFVAALSSCHMLVFLAIAAKRRWLVDDYVDDAIGLLAENADGRLAVTEVTLRPRVVFAGDRQPSVAQLERLHHRAHELCFIANSVCTTVTTEIVA
jgi:organic hydroperoxide reductase OsmC/OhrA